MASYLPCGCNRLHVEFCVPRSQCTYKMVIIILIENANSSIITFHATIVVFECENCVDGDIPRLPCTVASIQFTEQSLESWSFSSCFLGTTDLHADTATIETLPELLIVRLEVVGCCEAESVGMVCDSVWQFVSALQ